MTNRKNKNIVNTLGSAGLPTVDRRCLRFAEGPRLQLVHRPRAHSFKALQRIQVATGPAEIHRKTIGTASSTGESTAGSTGGSTGGPLATLYFYVSFEICVVFFCSGGLSDINKTCVLDDD